MPRLGWTLVVLGMLCVRSNAQPEDSPPARERETLDEAIALAGRQWARLPIVLTSTLPSAVSPNAEAWTVYDEACKGDRVFLYTRSGVFQCASEKHPLQHQCLLKLASVIVHESWHLEHGPDEAAAYTAQLLFLQMIEASAFLQLNEAAAAEIGAI